MGSALRVIVVVVVVVVARTRAARRPPPAARGCRSPQLAPLDASGISRVIEAHLGVFESSLPAAFVEFVATRVNGSSKHTKLITDSLVSCGALQVRSVTEYGMRKRAVRLERSSE